MLIFLYRILINTVLLISPLIIIIRIFNKKEHPNRFAEKIGIIKKNKNFSKLVWFHGSSVGEILSIIPLIEKLENKNEIKKILVTSNTLSSSKVLQKFKFKKTIHQFYPIDVNFVSKHFINHWNPSLALFVESEIWPNMLLNLKRKKIPIVLLNARITRRSFNKWKKMLFFAKSIFNSFNVCLTQNDETIQYLKKLGGKNIKKIGNLKFSETSLHTNNSLNIMQKNFFKKRKIFFGGISTHKSEEIFCAKIHENLKRKYNKGITIIIPRHVHRALEIKDQIEKMGLKVYLHSSKKKIDENIDIYIVDTFGETKLFLKICKIVFLGGSLVKHGGQNPLEAARLGCRVIHGPNISNFKEVYKLLHKIGIASIIRNIKETQKEIQKNLYKKPNLKKNIKKINNLGEQILSNNFKEIKKYI